MVEKTSNTKKDCACGMDNIGMPQKPVKLIFIHHSCGQNWLEDNNGGLGIALGDNNYFVSDTNYRWGPNSIGDKTDIGHFWLWFRGSDSETYLNALYDENKEHSSGLYSRMASEPAGENKIIMFKACFPNSMIRECETDAVPAISENPLRGESFKSDHHTFANAKGIYVDILEYFKTRQDKLFIAVTAPPLADPAYASNARVFNNWLVKEWLSAYPYKNVAVFDLYNVLTGNGGNSETNDLGKETGSHHRWWNGCIQHIAGSEKGVNPDVLKYIEVLGDDHPSKAGNMKATNEFVPLLNLYYNCWEKSRKA